MENRVQRQAGRRTNRIVSPPIENPFYGRAWKLLDLLVRDMRHPPCLPGQGVAAPVNWADPKIARVSPNRQGCPAAALGVSPQSSLLPGCRMLSPAWLAALHLLRRFRKLQIAVPRYRAVHLAGSRPPSSGWISCRQPLYSSSFWQDPYLRSQAPSLHPASKKLLSFHCLARRWHRSSCSGPIQACACPVACIMAAHQARTLDPLFPKFQIRGPASRPGKPASFSSCQPGPGCGLHAATATTQTGAVCV